MFVLEVNPVRYALFGRAEGIRCESTATYWASVQSETVTDATLSARAKGIRPGLSQRAAQALLPELEIHLEHDEPTAAMQVLWHTLYSVSPWLETVGHDAFYLQIPGHAPPLREVRDLLHEIDTLWGTEQRVRVGLAETPFLARALVAWSELCRVPGALYRKAGRQQLIISPGLGAQRQAGEQGWFVQLPVRAMWMLPEGERDRLLALGVRRWIDLQSIPFKLLRRHFGKQAHLWLTDLTQLTRGDVHVNYPPTVHCASWTAGVGEDAPSHQGSLILTEVVSKLAADLRRTGIGALKLRLRWETEHQTEEVVRVMKQPVIRSDVILAQLQPALSGVNGSLQKLEVFAEDIRPANTEQLLFTVHRNWLVPQQTIAQGEVESVLRQVNRKYPRKLQIGLRPSFRDMRLQAVLDGEAAVREAAVREVAVRGGHSRDD